MDNRSLGPTQVKIHNRLRDDSMMGVGITLFSFKSLHFLNHIHNMSMGFFSGQIWTSVSKPIYLENFPTRRLKIELRYFSIN